MRYSIFVTLGTSGTVSSQSILDKLLRSAPAISDFFGNLPGIKDFVDCGRERKYTVRKFTEYLETRRGDNHAIPAELEEVYDAAKDYIKAICPGEVVGRELGEARQKFLMEKSLNNEQIENRRQDAKKRKRSTVKTKKEFDALISRFLVPELKRDEAILPQPATSLANQEQGQVAGNLNPGFGGVQGVLDVQKESNNSGDQETDTGPVGARGLLRRQKREAVHYAELVTKALAAGRSGWKMEKMPSYLGIQDLAIIPEPETSFDNGVKISPEELCPAVEKLRNDQKAWDMKHAESIPYLLYDGEMLGDLGRITLGRRFKRKDDVTLFNIRNHPEWVIKYQSNCFTLDQYLLDLERDFWFQKLIEGRGIGPVVHFMSPPAKLLKYQTDKNYFETSWEEYIACAESERAYVRYMVMDRIPATLFDLMVRENNMAGMPLFPAVKFEMSLNMAKSVIAKLKIIHNLNLDLGSGIAASGMIHGDVHPGNIAQLKGANFIDFGLIDFGKALFGNEIKASIGASSYETHCFISHYAMNGASVSYRDDVYNTLLSAAFLMTGTEVYERCMAAARLSREAIIDFHSRQFLFDYTESRLVFFRAMPSGSDEEHNQVALHLKNALRLAREIQDVNDKPPYDAIINELDAILSIFKRLVPNLMY